MDAAFDCDLCAAPERRTRREALAMRLGGCEPCATEDPPGHAVTSIGPCWDPWEAYGGNPKAWLVVRASGTEAAPLLIGGYTPWDAGELEGGGGGDGSSGPTHTWVPTEEGELGGPADDRPDNFTPGLDDCDDPDDPSGANSAVVELDGGWRCQHARGADPLSGETEVPGPGHGVETGILFENTCWVELQDFAVKGFKHGIQVFGDCRHMVFRHIKVFENLRLGMQCRACPDLWNDGKGCLSGVVPRGSSCDAYQIEIPTRDEGWGGCANNKPSYLTGTEGYPNHIEITRSLFVDNGAYNNSTGAQLHVGDYCTNFHIHHNLFCMTAFGSAWESWPPLPTIIINSEGPAPTVTEVSKTNCAYLLDNMVDTCCKPTIFGFGVCDCDPDALSKSLNCQNAAARVKLCRGYEADPLRNDSCFGWAGDGITFELASSGHIVERCTFIGIKSMCGKWSRPDALHLNAEGCMDQSDGDGIDFKGLRVRTPDVDRPFTVVRHCLFLFNEGPALQAINGTQGLELYRNVIAGNGQGIKFASGDNLSMPEEWACRETSTPFNGEPMANGDTEQTVDWTEGGCYRVYRNLIYRNDRVDACYSGEGTGVGAGITLAAGSPLGAVYTGSEPRTLDRAFRFKDVWIVNNTIADNPGGGIAVSRPSDCLMEQTGLEASASDFRYPYPHNYTSSINVSVENKYLASCDRNNPDVEWLEALVRVTGLHILNNLLVDNGPYSQQGWRQIALGAPLSQWVGQAGNHLYDVTSEPDWNYERDDNRTFPETVQLDGNYYHRPDGDTRVARYSYDLSSFAGLYNTFRHEGSWRFVMLNGAPIVADATDSKAMMEDWSKTGRNYAHRETAWTWQDDPNVGYAFEEDWGEVDPHWDVLPASWSPEAYRPSADSLPARGGLAPSGIFDHGAYSGICTPSSSSGGTAVDVAANGAEAWSAAYDFGCQRASKHVGAWAPAPWNGTVLPFEWIDPAEYAKVDLGSMP